MNLTTNDHAKPVVRSDEPTMYALGGNHVAGIATPSRGARQVEMWFGRMEAGASSPPHSHDTEEVVHFLKGSGCVQIGNREFDYQAGDTLILPPGEVHQIIAETECEFIAAMPLGGTISLSYGEVMDLPWR